MLTILIADDSEQKIVHITKSIKSLDIQADISIASDITSIRKLLNEKKFDLLVLDQFMPVRIGEEIVENAGVQIIREIQRNKFNNIPRAIFGLTIAENITHDYFWPFYHHNDDNTWIKPFKALINYTSSYVKKYNENAQSYPYSIILEGVTDYTVLSKGLKLFYPKYIDELRLEYERSSGCNWVVRQLFAKVFLLPKKTDGTYVKFAPLFDSDHAGIEAIDHINTVIGLGQAERNHFKIFRYKNNYSPILKFLSSFLSQTTLEDFYPPSVWAWADENGLLEKRQTPLFSLSNIDIKEAYNACLLLESGISQSLTERYLNVYSEYFVPKEAKVKLANYYVNLNEQFLTAAMLPVKLVLSDILQYLDT